MIPVWVYLTTTTTSHQELNILLSDSHVDLDLVPLPQLHHHTLPHHAVLVIGVVVLIIEAGNLDQSSKINLYK